MLLGAERGPARSLLLGAQATVQAANAEELRMSILLWVVFGLIVGIIAKLLTPGRNPSGFLATALLGIAGAVLGGFIGRALGLYPSYQGTGGFFMSIVGAVILLDVYHAVVRRKAGVYAKCSEGRGQCPAIETQPGNHLLRHGTDGGTFITDERNKWAITGDGRPQVMGPRVGEEHDSVRVEGKQLVAGHRARPVHVVIGDGVRRRKSSRLPHVIDHPEPFHVPGAVAGPA
jgi:uncharacterized membrane protein YeaQ/YmgE (transglycosylase-associated protein family)